MVKRKATSPQINPSDTESKNATNPTPPLLSLPRELRFMIWETLVENPILLYGTEFTDWAPVQVTAVRSIALGSDYVEHTCRGNHQARKTKRRKKPSPLRWLRTSRQIYSEAQPLVYAKMSLHICNPMLLAALLDRTSMVNPGAIRSLSFCLRVKVQHDDCDGFTFALNVQHADHRWEGHPVCYCPWCFATKGLPQDGETMDLKFPALREVRLWVHFSCHQKEVNRRPRHPCRRGVPQQKDPLDRPENLSPLEWKGEEGTVQSLVDQISGQMPLRMFKGGRKKRVEVRFAVNRIEHSPSTGLFPDPTEWCWCSFRCLDEATLPTALFTSLIRTSLLKETSNSAGGHGDLQTITTIPAP